MRLKIFSYRTDSAGAEAEVNELLKTTPATVHSFTTVERGDTIYIHILFQYNE